MFSMFNTRSTLSGTKSAERYSLDRRFSKLAVAGSGAKCRIFAPSTTAAFAPSHNPKSLWRSNEPHCAQHTPRRGGSPKGKKYPTEPHKLHSCFSDLEIFLTALRVDLKFDTGTGMALRTRQRIDCSQFLPVRGVSIKRNLPANSGPSKPDDIPKSRRWHYDPRDLGKPPAPVPAGWWEASAAGGRVATGAFR